MYQDKTLICKECGAKFEFTVRDQEFFAEKGFTNEPTRCKDCRSTRKGNDNRQSNREMHPATCSSCGKRTQVPFRPSGDKPVYCNDCFSNRR